MLLQQGEALFHNTAICGFSLDVRTVKLGDLSFVEGLANRVKDPLIRVANRFKQGSGSARRRY